MRSNRCVDAAAPTRPRPAHLFLLALIILLMALIPTEAATAEPWPATDHSHQGVPEAVGDSAVQFAADGHVMAFRPGGYVLSNGQYALDVVYVGSTDVAPSSDAPTVSDGPGATPLGSVTYDDLYDGIELKHESVPDGIARSTWRIEPGADPRAIRMRYNRPVTINGDGGLTIAFETGEVSESAPIAWQERWGRRTSVQVRFVTFENQDLGFEVGDFDAALPLVIDPTLAWNTFLGGADFDQGNSIAIDGSGNVYVAGVSRSSWGSPIRAYTAGHDAFVAKLSPSGSLLWHTFLGGSAEDNGHGIAVDNVGNAYVAGWARASFGSPIRPYTANYDAFAAKLSSSGALTWHTFLGGSGADHCNSVAVDGSGNVFPAGHSTATWGSPISPHSGSFDQMSVRLDTNGNLVWHTFLGGAGWDVNYGVAVDTSGNVYLAGENEAWGTPVRGYSGGGDAVVAKLASNGAYTWHTYLGSANGDRGTSIAVDNSGNVYAGGYSFATWGSPLRPFGGAGDGFVTRLSPSGSLVWSTFLGGTSYEGVYDLAVDGSGNPYATGDSNATWGSPWRAHSGGNDAFAAELSPSGALTWLAFLGGSGTDWGYGIAVDGSSSVYTTGRSSASWGTPLRAYTANTDVFVAKIADDPTPTPTPTHTPTLTPTPLPEDTPEPTIALVGGHGRGRIAEAASRTDLAGTVPERRDAGAYWAAAALVAALGGFAWFMRQ